MDHTISTHWGGRVGRYAEFKGAVGRCSDPFARQPVQFALAFEYEAWLRSRFHGDTRSITHSRTHVTARQHDRELSAVATFVVTDRAGRQHYHLAVGNRTCEGQARALKQVAAQTGAAVVVTSLAELRCDVELFWRLEQMRQAAQLHEGEGAELDMQVLAVVRAGADSRDAVRDKLHHLHFQLLAARLAHLHCEGSLLLDFSRENFGASLVAGGEV